MLAPAANPLLEPWSAPYGLPPFDRIRPDHFAPAFERSMREHRAEIEAIATDPAVPTFENTAAALDRAGRLHTRLEHLFHALASSATSPELEAVEREVAPKLAAHRQAILTDARIVARLDAVRERAAALGLDAEAAMLVSRLHRDFVHAGAKLEAAARHRVARIVERLAALQTAFRQNVLHDEESLGLMIHDAAELAGLPDEVRATAREAAIARGEPDAWFVTMSRSAVVPFLVHAERRELRERAFRLWTSRGEHDGDHDNRPVATEILALRQELARLHGYRTYGDYALADRMARTPAAVAGLLERVWAPARRKAQAERDALAACAAARGRAHAIEPWDWRYYAEQVRRERYAVDEDEAKPYFSLDRMTEAMFDCAGRLFGLEFDAREGLPVWHPDVRAWEVRRDGRAVGLFMADNFLRPGKRSGAWMSSLREQSRRDGEVLPIVLNNNNFVKAPHGEPTLLSADDVRTLFHEFGHGLHGLLSRATWERLSGTNVLRSFSSAGRSSRRCSGATRATRSPASRFPPG
jgi:peptidyl-dipeptidase Dcp